MYAVRSNETIRIYDSFAYRGSIKDMQVRDDYASMRQAVGRRFARLRDGDEKFSELPQLLLVDGGATHADAARQVVSELGLNIPIFGMVKDDRHRTRALVTADGKEIGISTNQAMVLPANM